MKEKGLVTDKKRTPLGDKGLGRLSTQRLGDILEMFTGKKGDEIQHHVAFDWRHFTESSSLENVDTNYQNHVKPVSQKGTRLLISNLKNSSIWTGEARDKFRGQLSKLIFPFKEDRPFNIYLNINGQDSDLDEINDKLRQLAISRYKFEFDGKAIIIEGALKFAKLQGNSNEKRDLYHQLIQLDKGENFFHFLKSQSDNKQYFIPDLKYSGKEGVFFSFKREFEFGKDIQTDSIFDEKQKKLIPANPCSFSGEIDEFNLSGTEDVESAYDTLSEYKQLVKNQVGVRIFRDGFGIKPYGMEDNDWLKLSKGQTSGGSFYLLRPENVIGFVSISARENKMLIEKTDREGFIDSPYSRNFFNIIDLVVSNINNVLDRTRRSYDSFRANHAQTRGDIRSFKDTKDRLITTAKQSAAIEGETKKVYDELKDTSAKVSAAVAKIRKEPLFSSEEENRALNMLEEVERLLNNAKTIFQNITSILENAKKLEDDANYLEPKINELENQILQFSELAGLGITAEAFTHEMYNIIDRIGSQTDQVIKQIKKDNPNSTTFFVYAEHVKSFIISVRRQLNHLAPSLKFNRETKQEIRLSSFVNELKEYYHIRTGGKIDLNVKVLDDFDVQVNKGKLTQIVDNIILNSEYWLSEIAKTDHSFRPAINIEVKSPLINISDNGYGIAPTLEETLFQPFVTTKPKDRGRGLGLFIVQQLLDSIGATIVLLGKRNQHNRRFIFQINLEPTLINL